MLLLHSLHSTRGCLEQSISRRWHQFSLMRFNNVRLANRLGHAAATFSPQYARVSGTEHKQTMASIFSNALQQRAPGQSTRTCSCYILSTVREAVWNRAEA